MKRMKQLILVSCFVACMTFGRAQTGLTIDASQLYTSFHFTDKEGVKHNSEYQGLFTGAYGIGFRYVNDIGLIIKPGIGIRSAGANLEYDERNYAWKLQYGELKLGLGYMTRFTTVNPYFMASGYYAFLLRGVQSLNDQHFNITKSNILNNIDYGVVFSPGVDIKLSDYVNTYIQFDYLRGLTNIETDPGQKSKNIAYGITIGISVSFSAK
ncbi:MAG: outer membrane beta-barrel protein [Saprospiraceae bacterium]